MHFGEKGEICLQNQQYRQKVLCKGQQIVHID